MTLRDKIIGTVRTTVAGAVAAVLTWAAVHLHIVLSPRDSDLVKGAVFAVLLAGYHAGASALQRRWAAYTKTRPDLARWTNWLVALLLGSSLQPVGYARAGRAAAGLPITWPPRR